MPSDPVERARALTGQDGRGLYQALIERFVTFGKHTVAGIPLRDYASHLPTDQLVAAERGRPVVWEVQYDLNRVSDIDGYWGDWAEGYARLLAVWAYSNEYPSERKLRVSRARADDLTVIDAPWLDAPRTVQLGSR